MPMHWVPWLAGGFLLTPFLVWLGLQAFMFPGAWNGFTTVVGTAALVASLPLAAWFFMRGIGGFANAMAGADPDGELAHRLPRTVLRVLPLAAVVLGVAGAWAVLESALVRELAFDERGGQRWFAVNLVLLGALLLFVLEISTAALTVLLLTLAVAGGTAYLAWRERAARNRRSGGGQGAA